MASSSASSASSVSENELESTPKLAATTTSERIYVGGLNPPNLTVKDIVSRIKSIKDIQILNEIGEESQNHDNDEDNDEKTFVHLTAVSKHTQNTALQIISKLYNNVKWKGCRIVIEKAKPNFLDRLKEERKQIQQQKEAQKEQVLNNHVSDDSSVDDPDKVEKVSMIPRRLRIRKKFGQQAYFIDTQPWEVDNSNWKRFAIAKTKLQKRAEKHLDNINATTTDHSKKKKQQKKETKPTPSNYYHRAIHMRFDYDEDTNNNDQNYDIRMMAQASNKIDNQDESSSDSSSSSSDSDGDYDYVSGSGEEKIIKNEKPSYAWSDDDESDSDDDFDSEEKKAKLERGMKGDDQNNESDYSVLSSEDDEELDGRVDSNFDDVNAEENDEDNEHKVIATTSSDDDDDGDSTSDEEKDLYEQYQRDEDDDDEDDSSDVANEQQQARQEEKNDSQQETKNPSNPKQSSEGGYAWSSSSSSDSNSNSSDDEDRQEQTFGSTKKRLFEPSDSMNMATTIGAFGMDEFATGWSDESSEGRDDNNEDGGSMNVETDTKIDLTNDVSANMGILSSLFPDLATNTIGDDDTGKRKQSSSGGDDKMKLNSTNTVVMPRFDPNALSSQQFVLEDDKDAEMEKKDESKRSSEDEDAESKKDEDTCGGPNKEDGKEEQKEETTSENKKQDQLYEEKKLEDVFREARVSRQQQLQQAKTISSSQPSSAGTAGAGGGFSFGFFNNEPETVADKETEEQVNATGEGGFSFGFSIPSAGDNAQGVVSSNQKEDDDADDDGLSLSNENTKAKSVAQEAEDGNNNNRRSGHRGMHVPANVLERYVSAFYSLNDGDRIMEDPQGFRNSQEVQSKWHKERLTLTLDWKRKRKYAQSRIQKRMKYR